MLKVTTALLAAAVTVSASQARHAHQHIHKARQAPTQVEDFTVVPGPTEVVYVLNGNPISEEDVQEGIKNGSLVWAPGGQLESSAAAYSSSSPESTAAPAPTEYSSSSSAYVAPSSSAQSSQWSAPSSYSAWTPSSAPSSSWSAPASSSAAAPASYSSSTSSNSGSSSGFSGTSSGVDTPFPDGQLDCSTFPSEYGAVAVDWMGLGGWTGVQQPGSDNGGFSNIMTVTTGTCSGSSCCGEGMFCSYACPAGYQKSQWPSTQGATGQSVGGIQCLNGKLHLTNPSMSKNLCMTGAEEVTVLVENNLSQNVAICRTDYPGTEGETVPLNVEPNTTDNLTCPDAARYYNWEGSHTSAQYYVNPKGVAVNEACQWGSSANPWGNFAPLNLGVGYSNGAAWLSIFQNAPTTQAQLDFAIEIQGDGMSGTCKYSNGQYCGGANYDQCSSTTGCTVSLSSGTAKFVLSDS